MYAKLITCAIGCFALSRIFRVVTIATTGTIPIGFHVGYFGSFGCFLFLLSANYGIMNTTTFEAGPYDIVVIKRVPLINYEYQLFDPITETWSDKEVMIVSAPQRPSYYSLTIEDYNEFVEQYNKVYSGKYDGSSTVLYPITDDILPG